MFKLSMFLLIAVLILNCFSLGAEDKPYQPPRDDELWSWWNTLTDNQKIDEIRKLDIIEHTVPEITINGFTAILTKDGDLIIDTEPIKIKIYYLSYSVQIEPQRISGFYTPDRKTFLDYLFPIITSMGTAVLGTALADNAYPWQYGVSALQGATIGIFLSIRL